jgi:hypothetical protein
MYVPTKDTNIDEVFDRIYAKEFKEYLCEILDGKHTYHIFNTYIFIEYGKFFSGNFTFFTLLALKPEEKIGGVFNEIYMKKMMKKQKEINFMKDMQYVIDIFLNIYEFPSNPIIEPTDEYKNTHTNQEIIDVIQRTGIIHKETHDAKSSYRFITDNKTTGSIIKKLPFVYLAEIPFTTFTIPFTILIENEEMKKLYGIIVKSSNSKTRSSRQSSEKPLPIEGIAEYIPGLSPRSKRSTRRNTSRFDKTKKKYAYKPSTVYKYKLRRFTHGKKRPRK